MPRKPCTERALSDAVTIALILILVVAAAAIVFIVVFGYANLAPKSAYVTMRGVAANTSVGAATITLFHFEGDAVNLNGSVKGTGVAPVRFSLRTPQSMTEPVGISPLITDNTWGSGDTISIYEDGSGYWMIDNVSARIAKSSTLGPLISMPAGNYTISVVDAKANVLIAQVPVQIAGIGIAGPQYSPGLIATYYSDQGWTTPAATNIAQRVYFADAASGRSSDISNWPVGLIGKADHFSVRFDGFLKVDTEADYTFTLSSDDGSWMDLNGTSNFISNGGDHAYASVSATRHLQPGYHPVSVRMYENGGAAVVYLQYKTPAMASPALVTQLYHTASTPPTADFIGAPSAGPVPLAVQFTDTSSDATSWSWDFGDSSGVSHAKNPSHTYATLGKYTVTLTATNSFGSNTAVKANYITAGSFSPGFSASYYRGQSWTELTGSRIESPIQFSDQSSAWPTDMVGRQDNFSVSWDGYLQVPAAGTYTFYLNSDDGSWLWVDDTLLIDNGGDHAAREYTGVASLTSAYHHVVVRMYENGGVAIAGLRYTNSSVTTPQYVTNIWHT
jgi:PKD repeat protein